MGDGLWLSRRGTGTSICLLWEWQCWVPVMRSAAPTGPGLVPSFDVTVYLVLDDFGKIGRAYREADEEKSDLETVIQGMLVGEYKKSVRVVAFNSAEGWSRDVSEDIAWEVLNRASSGGPSLPPSTHNFVAFHVGELTATGRRTRFFKTALVAVYSHRGRTALVSA
jgi:hypothetical protein